MKPKPYAMWIVANASGSVIRRDIFLRRITSNIVAMAAAAAYSPTAAMRTRAAGFQKNDINADNANVATNIGGMVCLVLTAP